MPPMKRLSHAIAEGDGISILVEVDDVDAAQEAERHGAEGLVVGEKAGSVRSSSQLPVLVRGSAAAARGLSADAVVIAPDPSSWDEATSVGLEGVVRIERADELERSLAEFDPEVFLLTVETDADGDPLEVLLGLLHDVPAGKLAIAELHDANVADVAELERSGFDAVLVASGDIRALVPTGSFDV
jgi:indole-3-glycerol phosphate synthase